MSDGDHLHALIATANDGPQTARAYWRRSMAHSNDRFRALARPSEVGRTRPVKDNDDLTLGRLLVTGASCAQE